MIFIFADKILIRTVTIRAVLMRICKQVLVESVGECGTMALLEPETTVEP
jgi:hypothetical protein